MYYTLELLTHFDEMENNTHTGRVESEVEMRVVRPNYVEHLFYFLPKCPARLGGSFLLGEMYT